MQEETSFHVSPFLSMSQTSKAFESSWEICPKVLSPRNDGGELCGDPQASEFDMKKLVMTTEYIINMFSISKLKLEFDK